MEKLLTLDVELKSLAITFIFLYIVIIIGNTLAVLLDKKLSLNKLEIIGSSLVVTIIFFLLEDYLMKFLSLNIFLLFVFLSSASSYKIAMWFAKNNVYMSLIGVIKNIFAVNKMQNDKKKDEIEETKEDEDETK